MKIKFFLLLLFLIFFYDLRAQPIVDSVKKSLAKKPYPFAKFDNRNSFIENSLVNVLGFKIGLSYDRRISFGLGYYQLYNPPNIFKEKEFHVNDLGNVYVVSKGLKMYYFSANAEYIFYQTNYWKLSMPLQIGFGKTYYQYTLERVTYRINQSFNFIYEPTISVNYRIIKWIGLSFDFGYRFMIAKNAKLNRQFTSPIIASGISIYYSEILKSIFPKNKFLNSR